MTYEQTKQRITQYNKFKPDFLAPADDEVHLKGIRITQ